MKVLGAESVEIRSDLVQAWVTEVGGQLGPVTFRLGEREVRPLSVAPWHDEPVDEPPCIQALRGDFFCFPFGGNAEAFEGERHPIHGETANSTWSVAESHSDQLVMELELTIRKGCVRKEISVESGQAAVYSRHIVSGAEGPMPIGHHAMLAFRSQGLVSTSPFEFGQVFPGRFEDPKIGGYSSLKPGARFERLNEVPMADGSHADLSRYPAREGFEDLAMVFARRGDDFAWTAVAFPEEGYVWFSLKDPRVLSGTVLWHSNGGRWYAPWNGRHRRVLGLEEVTAYFHYGLKESAQENEARRAGFRTAIDLEPCCPLVVNTIFGVAEIGPRFDHVERIEREEGRIALISRSGERIFAPVRHHFLSGA